MKTTTAPRAERNASPRPARFGSPPRRPASQDFSRRKASENPDPKDPDNAPRSGRQHISFIRAFLVVLAIHVVLGGGLYAYSGIRKLIASDKLALNAKTPAYAGVPETSAKPLNASSAASSSLAPVPNEPSPTKEKAKVATTAQPSKAQSIPRIQDQKKSVIAHHSLQPTPEIRALFSHNHPSDKISNSTLTPDVKKTPTEAIAEAIHESPESPSVPLVATPHPSPAPPSTYTVGPGDTLSGVASMMGIPAADIRKANDLGTGNSLKVGQTLKIPVPNENHPLQLVEKKAETVPTPERPERFVSKMDRIAPNGVYVVQHGDNPYMVARKLGVSFTDLMVANDITNPADVSVGMRLKVPGSTLASN
jgi:LysM repeat protein